jgi:hypothetical protein
VRIETFVTISRLVGTNVQIYSFLFLPRAPSPSPPPFVTPIVRDRDSFVSFATASINTVHVVFCRPSRAEKSIFADLSRAVYAGLCFNDEKLHVQRQLHLLMTDSLTDFESAFSQKNFNEKLSFSATF